MSDVTWYPVGDEDAFRDDDGERTVANGLHATLHDMGGGTATITGRGLNDKLVVAVSVVRRDTETLCVVVRDDCTVEWFTDTDYDDAD